MKIKLFLLMISLTLTNAFANDITLANQVQAKLGVQLYSVRDDLKKDFAGTLTQLAKMGLKGVEFAGIYGGYEDKPEQLKALLDKLQLKAAGAHIKIKHLRGKELDKNIAFFKALDCKYLIVSWDDRVKTKEGSKELGKELSAIAKTLKKHGMQTGYHNHDDELKDIDGTTYWDILATSSSHDVILQQDVGWTTYAGKDPVHYVHKYPGRTLSTHYKAKYPDNVKGKKPIIGQDIIDWENLLRANVEVGNTQWFILEQEDYPDGLTPLQSVQASLDGLNKILKKIK